MMCYLAAVVFMRAGEHTPAERSVRPQISVQVDVVTVPVTVTDAHGNSCADCDSRISAYGWMARNDLSNILPPKRNPLRCSCWWRRGLPCYLLRGEHRHRGRRADRRTWEPTDRMAIASYSDAPRLLLDFTTDKRQAAATLGSLGYGLGMAQLKFLRQLGCGCELAAIERNGKRAIVVLTTGLDSSGEAGLGSPGR